MMTKWERIQDHVGKDSGPRGRGFGTKWKRTQDQEGKDSGASGERFRTKWERIQDRAQTAGEAKRQVKGGGINGRTCVLVQTLLAARRSSISGLS